MKCSMNILSQMEGELKNWLKLIFERMIADC